MKVKGLQKILAAISAVTFMIAAALLFSGGYNVNAAENGEGINLVSVTDYNMPDASYAEYFTITVGEDAEYGTYVKFKANQGVTEKDYNIFYYVNWQLNTTYDISFRFKTDANWQGNSGGSYGARTGSTVFAPSVNNKLDITAEDWTLISFKFTPQSLETANNVFMLNITVAEGGEFYIADLKIAVNNKAPSNSFSAENLTGSAPSFYSVNAEEETFEGKTFGAGEVITLAPEAENAAFALEYSQEWQAGYSRVSFWVYTQSQPANSGKVSFYKRLNGTENVALGTYYYNGNSGCVLNSGAWNYFSYVIYNEEASNASLRNSLYLWVDRLYAGDLVKIAGLKIESFSDLDADDCGNAFRLIEEDCYVYASDGHQYLTYDYGFDMEQEFLGEEIPFDSEVGRVAIYNGYNEPRTEFLSVDIPLAAGMQYRVSYYVKFGYTPATGNALRFQPVIYTQGVNLQCGDTLAEEKNLYLSEYNGFDNSLKLAFNNYPAQWERYSYTFTAIAEDPYASVRFQTANMAPGEKIYIAMVSVLPESHLFGEEREEAEYLKESGQFEDIYYTCCHYCGMSSFGTAYEDTFTSVTDTLETVGAAIRIAEGEDAGMRFISRFSKEKLAGITGEYEIGTIIKGGVYEGDTLTAETAGAVNIVNRSGSWNETEQDTYISAYIWGIDRQHYASEITARAYIKITEGGETSYIYGDATVRSLAGVAESALADVSDTEGGIYIYPLNDGSGLYSPYDDETRAELAAYAGIE